MPQPIKASMTVRYIYIAVALVVLVGLGWWLYGTYNVDPEPVMTPDVTTTN